VSFPICWCHSLNRAGSGYCQSLGHCMYWLNRVSARSPGSRPSDPALSSCISSVVMWHSS
jgi:hypothetical protein